MNQVDGAASSHQNGRSLIRWMVSIAAAVALAAVVLVLLSGPRVLLVPSGSMAPTIAVDQSVLVESLTYRFRAPQSGDLVLFDSPPSAGGPVTLIKRVVAVAGQTVDFQNGSMVIDGVAVKEPYTRGKPSNRLDGSRVAYPATVPEGFVWVMGDNRVASQDSRWFGPIPISPIRGKIAFLR